jgi:hypothetical protein
MAKQTKPKKDIMGEFLDAIKAEAPDKEDKYSDVERLVALREGKKLPGEAEGESNPLVPEDNLKPIEDRGPTISQTRVPGVSKEIRPDTKKDYESASDQFAPENNQVESREPTLKERVQRGEKPVVQPVVPSAPVAKASAAIVKSKIMDRVQQSADSNAEVPADELAKATHEEIKAAQADASMPKDLKKDAAWLEAKYKELADKEDAEKESLEWRQALETVANSVTQLFAAREGLKRGVDMSGLKLDKQDFDAKFANFQKQTAARRQEAENINAKYEQGVAQTEAIQAREGEVTAAKKLASVIGLPPEQAEAVRSNADIEVISKDNLAKKMAVEELRKNNLMANQLLQAEKKENAKMARDMKQEYITQNKELLEAANDIAMSDALLKEAANGNITSANLLSAKIGKMVMPGVLSDEERKLVSGDPSMAGILGRIVDGKLQGEPSPADVRLMAQTYKALKGALDTKIDNSLQALTSRASEDLAVTPDQARRLVANKSFYVAGTTAQQKADTLLQDEKIQKAYNESITKWVKDNPKKAAAAGGAAGIAAALSLGAVAAMMPAGSIAGPAVWGATQSVLNSMFK